MRRVPILVLSGVFIALLVSVVQVSFGAYTPSRQRGSEGSRLLVAPIVAPVGVKTGDWIKYSGTTSGSGGIEGFGDLNETSWIEAKVTSVSGTSVTMQIVAHFKNNSETDVGRLIGDVSTGSGNLSFILLPAPMSKDSVIPSWVVDVPGLRFNDTVTRPYAGVNRTVNVLNVSLPQETYNVMVLAFWDQETGILVETSTSNMVPGQSFQLKMKATETNMWSTGGDIGTFLLDNLIYIVGLIVVIVIIVAVAVVMMRRRRLAPAPAAQPTAPAVEQKPA